MTVAMQPSGQASLPTPDSTKSYWHREPSKLLLGHRTTPQLPSTADVIIIGSGITGSCAARFIREAEQGKELNVVMLEAREACWGATGRNGGHCQPLLYSRSAEVAAFELRNYQTIKALIAEHKVPCDWRTLTGVHAYMNESMFEHGLESVKTLQETDPELAKLIQIVTKESKSPSLDDLQIPSAAGAFIQAHAASLWPYKLVAWILENLLAANKEEGPAFNLQTTTPVTHLQRLDDGSWITHTPRGMITSKRVLLATNGYTSHLVPKFSDLIVPVRGEMSSLIPPKSMRPTSTHHPLDHSYIFLGHGKQNINQDDYLVQRPFIAESSDSKNGGELMFGGGRSYAANTGFGVSNDSAIDEPAAAYLRRELSVALNLENEKQELEASYEWSGIMGYSRDNRPWVGELREELRLGGGEGLWLCAGFTGHGMPNTCLSAKAVVHMMVGVKPEEVDLPKEYRLSKERVEAAKASPTVQVADAGGLI